MKEGIRGFRPADKQEVLALWNESGIAMPWLDLDAEIDEKLKRDPEFFWSLPKVTRLWAS